MSLILPRNRFGLLRRTIGSAGGTEILGKNAIGGTSAAYGANSLVFTNKFTPTQTGTITQVDFYSANSAALQDVKIGIYTDSSDAPNTLVGSETAFTDTGTWSTGWKAFTTSFAVTASSTYWVCMKVSLSGITYYYDSTAGRMRFKADTYANAFPATASGLSTFAADVSIRLTNAY
jgi:hypothetical protein